jgi:hypothetical protein
MRRLLVLLVPFAMAQTAPGPIAPESGHSRVVAPKTLCGITATSALDFERQVKASAEAKQLLETDRFVAYDAPDTLTQWVFAKPGNSAYPLATCRHAYVNDGSWYMNRDMRCDDTRERCDKALLEFEHLDQQAKEAVQQKVRG